MFKRIGQFFREVSLEMRKVTWLTRYELFDATVAVLISTAIFTAFIGMCDFVFTQLLNFVLK